MKNLLQNKEFQLDEILFENRNKSYGAYVLRNESDRILTKAMFVGIAVFAAIAVTPFVANAFKTAAPPIETPLGPVILRDIPDNPDKPVEIVKPAIEKPVETVKLEIPTPKKVLTKEETPATSLSETDDAKIGTENIKGEKAEDTYKPIIPTGPVEVPSTKPVEKPQPVDDSPKTVVDVQANFNGGINSFRTKMIDNFDTGIFDGSGDVISTVVTFIVEKDGSISGVKANGKDAAFNKEAERTIKSIKGKWTPAKIKGEAVRSYFKFPVSMQFE